ncbi:hypothetical protein L873DRAFT_1780403 [Choiromyces venosus 120613-1]|uniref:PiggyBac transposable element-derived protein domain-containing protein n=1 Tax=Choiromyces venosus 120613-1 TaxID=1336337 RepID=A0A3N4J5Z6_9PEZI|nr:hypothetical protein L873DRAFT_1780403 [Choiromyces venosus 120613-1]
MGSVDIADQLRSYYSTQQCCRRNWLPLFYWLLDTSLVNAYRIQRTINSPAYWKQQSQHFHFRSEVADKVIHEGIRLNETETSLQSGLSSPNSPRPVPREPKVTYIPHTHRSHHTLRTDSRTGPTPAAFPPPRPTPVTFPPPEAHTLEQRPTRTLCLLCHWQRS